VSAASVGVHALALQSFAAADWYELHPHLASAASASAHHHQPKTAWQRFKDGARSVFAFIFGKVGICVLVIGYLLLGAVAFQQIEGPNEMLKPRFAVTAYREDTVRR
jgi:hypothetical protein